MRPFTCTFCPHILSSEQSFINHLYGAHEVPLVALPDLLVGKYKWRTQKDFFACACDYCVRSLARAAECDGMITGDDMNILAQDAPL